MGTPRYLPKDLHDSLIQMLDQLQRQINCINVLALDTGVQIYTLRSTDGSFMLAPLLVAKTNALVALAQLQSLPTEVLYHGPDSDEVGEPKDY